MYPEIQEHMACPLLSRHCELGPQGDGWHGLVSIGAKIGNETYKKISSHEKGVNLL